jgi:hypothetical protein
MLDKEEVMVAEVAAQRVLLARWPPLLVCAWPAEVFITFWPGKPEQLVELSHQHQAQT